eukprot:GSChrysophyteH1.ASY1.ANO1.946.1 assembled CDS
MTGDMEKKPDPPSEPPSTLNLRPKSSEAADVPTDSESDSDVDEVSLKQLKSDKELKESDGQFSEADADAMGENIFREILRAFYEARYLGTFLAFVGLYIGYQLTIAPYQVNQLDRTLNPIHDLGLIRPILTDNQQAGVRHNTLHGETNFVLPEPYNDEIKVRFHRTVAKDGVFPPPQLFYEGVMFGVGESNSHDLKYTGHKDYYSDRHLLETKQTIESSLNSMNPKPTFIAPRRTMHNDTGWDEEGYAVYFAYDDLLSQGKLSSDKLKPWKRVLEDVLDVAREFRQVYVTVWYPHEFGAADDDDVEGKAKVKVNPNSFTSILQQIIPTRTGLRGIGSIVPVWMSAVNHSAPTRRLVEKAVRKDWSSEDHWTHYVKGGEKHREFSKEELEAMGYELHGGVQAVGKGPDISPEELRAKREFEF